ncbi:unnamed protein product [Caenorhabditis brenneri]
MSPIDGNQQTAEIQKEQHTRINEEDEESIIEWAKFEKEQEMFRPPAEKASVFDFLFSLGCFLSILSVKNAYLEEFVNEMKKKIKTKIGDDERVEYSSISENLTNVFDSSMNIAKTMETTDEIQCKCRSKRIFGPQDVTEKGKQGHGKFLKITAIKRRVWFHSLRPPRIHRR